MESWNFCIFPFRRSFFVHVHHFHPDFNGKTKYVTKLVAEKVLFINGTPVTYLFNVFIHLPKTSHNHALVQKDVKDELMCQSTEKMCEVFSLLSGHLTLIFVGEKRINYTNSKYSGEYTMIPLLCNPISLHF